MFQRRKHYSRWLRSSRCRSSGGGGARPGDRIDHVRVLEGGGSVKSDQVPRGKLWRVIKSAFICLCQAGDDIALFRLIGDDVHPYRINYCDGPISSRARQLNRDIAEVPRVSDRNVVNVASSKATAPLINWGLVQARGRINTFSMGQKYLCGVGHRIGKNHGCGRPGIWGYRVA